MGGRSKQRPYHVQAEAALVRQGRPWTEDAAIDLAVKVLQKLPEQHALIALAATVRINVHNSG